MFYIENYLTCFTELIDSENTHFFHLWIGHHKTHPFKRRTQICKNKIFVQYFYCISLYVPRLMARFYMAYETMKNFNELVREKKENGIDMKALLKVLCESKELQGL